jgi:hypothetical protein
LWLVVLGGCLAFVIYALKTKPATNTITSAICINEEINPFVAVTTITPLINDTLVFLAITWRLSCNSYARHTLKNGFKFLVFGDYLPVFSKVLLQDGQAYYLLVLFLIYISWYILLFP